MQRVLTEDLHLWKFDRLEKFDSLRHFVTDRHTNGGAEFTLSYSSSPDKSGIKANRQQLARAMQIREDELFFPSQVHETRIVEVTRATPKEELLGTDALITREKGICIAVMSADCVPILLYDTENNVVAAVHSGWRGTVARILEKTLVEMRSRFSTRGEHVVAGIGPSVSQDSYEVGEEVVREVIHAFGHRKDLLIPQPLNKARLDLWKANIIQLNEFGVPDANIEVSNLCTLKNNHHFFSARKGDAGRFAAGIMMV